MLMADDKGHITQYGREESNESMKDGDETFAW